jgi:hypothetical protein
MDNIKKNLILWYLNYDEIDLTEKEIYEQSKIYNIPFQIFLKKLIERLVSEHKADKQSILTILTTNMGLQFSDDVLTHVIDLIDLIEPITIISRKKSSLTDINKKLYLFDKLNTVNNTKATHTGQPLPDPETGRPYIYWRECYHEGCHKKFTYEHELIEHLKYMGAYTKSYHKIHEDYVSINKLTEDKVIAKKMNKCPAYICNCTVNSPEEVIAHFRRLGIYPFWKKGMDFSSKSVNTNYEFDKNIKIFNVDTCIICLDNKPNIILDKCLHCCFCVDCFLSSNSSTTNETIPSSISKCPICKSFYSKVYPY